MEEFGKPHFLIKRWGFFYDLPNLKKIFIKKEAMVNPPFIFRGLFRSFLALLFAFTFLSLSTPEVRAAAGDVLWNSQPNMPWAINQLGLAAAGGKLYTVGGYATGDTGSLEYPVQVYDPVENTWMLKAPIPTSRSGLGAASVNGKIYAIGGYKPGLPEGEGWADEVEEYDPQTNTWRNRTPMPTKRFGVGVAELNGKIYVAGGISFSEYQAKLEMYDPATDTWTILPPMMAPRSEFALVASKGKLYAIGGLYYQSSQGQQLQYLNTVESYDPVAGIWSTKASLPNGLGLHGAVAIDNGHIHVFGGRNTAISNTVMKYDPEANSWSPAGTMPNSRYNFGIAKVAGENIYLVGGNTTFNSNYPVNLTDRATVVSPWTIMFYIAADNSLGGFLTGTMAGLRQQAGANPNVQVVAIVDSAKKGTTYYWLNGDPTVPFVEGENAWYQGNLDMGNSDTLVNFVNLARNIFPAEHYALVFDDHGMGVSGAMTDDSSPKDISGDPSYLTLSEIRQALEKITELGVKKIDVLFFYTCSMAMLETAYELRGLTDYFVASEDTAFNPPDGYPNYVSNVQANTMPAALATKFVNDYGESFNAQAVSAARTGKLGRSGSSPNDLIIKGGKPWTMSAAQMGSLNTLVNATNALALNLSAGIQEAVHSPVAKSSAHLSEAALKSLIIVSKIQVVRNSVRSFYHDLYVDLYDFARLVKEKFDDAATQATAQQVMDAVKAYVIHERHHSGINYDLETAHGVAVWFPRNSSSFYKGQFLQFAEGTQWSTSTLGQLGQGGPAWGPFLVQFIQATNPQGEDISKPPPLLAKESIGTYLYLPLILR